MPLATPNAPSPRRPLSLRLLLPLLPALATVLVLLVVLWANDSLVTRDLARRAHFRAEQTASVYADQVERVLTRRMAELELVARVASAAPSPQGEATREAMAYLQAHAPSLAGVALIGSDGQPLIALGDTAGLVWRTERLRPITAPQLMPPEALIRQTGAARASPWLAALTVPLKTGAFEGHLVSLLRSAYFDELREFALGDVAARREMELVLRARDGTVLLGPPAMTVGIGLSADSMDDAETVTVFLDAQGEELAVASRQVQSHDSTFKPGWETQAIQPMTAATRPALRLQESLLLWGLLAIALIGGAGMWLSRRLARPYDELLDAVARRQPMPLDGAPGAYLRAVSQALQQLDSAGGSVSDPLLARVLHDAQRLQTVLDQLPSPVYLLDAQGAVTYWNQQAEAVFGWSAKEALGQTVQKLLPGDVHAHGEASAQGDAPPFEARTRNRRGEELWCEWRLLALSDPTGQGLGQMALVRDISDRMRAEAALAQHQIELSELTQRLLQQEQQTSRRMAQTLHDQLGQTLSAIRLTFDALRPLWRSAEERQQTRAQSLDKMIGQANAEVRQALVELRPPLLEDEGLAMALENDINLRQPEAEPVALQLEVAGGAATQRWPANVEYAAFMVAREAVGNALLHADASLVQIRLSGGAGGLQLNVADNGIGLPADLAFGRPGHLGLVGMRERALAIGARLEFQPVAGGGLNISLRWAPSAIRASTPTGTLAP
ncbi:sensor histidine kinase [Hydrogenophaga crassostreae]|nr:PAS domain-containing sensor histidine kinase [Hydrogenophaga crassostreae]